MSDSANSKIFINDSILKGATGHTGLSSNNKYWTEEFYAPIKTNTFNHNIFSANEDKNNNKAESNRYPFKVQTWVDDVSKINKVLSEDAMEIDVPKDYFNLNKFDRLKKENAQSSSLSMDDIRGAVGTGGESIPGLTASSNTANAGNSVSTPAESEPAAASVVVPSVSELAPEPQEQKPELPVNDSKISEPVATQLNQQEINSELNPIVSESDQVNVEQIVPPSEPINNNNTESLDVDVLNNEPELETVIADPVENAPVSEASKEQEDVNMEVEHPEVLNNTAIAESGKAEE